MKRKASLLLVGLLLLALVPATTLAEKPVGSGAGKTDLYNSNAFTCEDGATDLSDGPYGFVVLNTNADGTVIVQVSLKRATPEETYDVWVNQTEGTCPLDEPTAPETLTTNRRGNGNAHVEVERYDGATRFWVSVVGGGQMLRSVAVELD